ncbi:MAG: hypothetical protein DME19_12495 [Verrucomicrobia bacterium]|nr:MAG: hypothetical protein DME19_12495 [Verrucomicrobiota bacterium]
MYPINARRPKLSALALVSVSSLFLFGGEAEAAVSNETLYNGIIHWSRPDRRAFCPVSDKQGVRAGLDFPVIAI